MTWARRLVLAGLAAGGLAALAVMWRGGTDPELTCLARNIYFEARGESLKGQEGVAAVTLNRVASPRYPDNVCAVVHQGGRRGCAFSWTCDEHPEAITEPKAWETALRVARRALDGHLADPTDGALFYHATHVSPYWARPGRRTVRIGNHIFYR